MDNLSNTGLEAIIDSLSDGMYVCDLDRKITYWSKSAERITGWRSEDVIGRPCHDNILCHMDKDGHRLCGEEYCPLHRAMVTDTQSKNPLLVYAQGSDGRRIPTLVGVVPFRNDDGEVIGGVETFQDASKAVHDLERAKAIQHLALHQDLPEDPRIRFTTHYVPHDIVGGDFYALRMLDANRYSFMLADVMGHGIAAALYTMHLSQLWERHGDTLADPVEFAGKVNKELANVVKTDESFATAVCGLIDLENRKFRFTGAGGPQVLLMHTDGAYECLESSGLPLAVLENAIYEEVCVEIQKGDRLLFFSDGAVEVLNAAGKMLGVDGLIEILRKQGYPDADIQMNALEEALLVYSNSIRLDDDLTLVEMRLNEF